MSDIEKARREKQRQQSLKDQRDMTVEEWCEKRRLSKPTYYKLDRMGLGPEWYELLGSRRITPAADLVWEKKALARNKTKAAGFRKTAPPAPGPKRPVGRPPGPSLSKAVRSLT